MEDNLNEIKRNVVKDWQREIPELFQYAQNKLYKIIGPIIVGIELIKLPRSEEYRPHFVMYALWKDDIKECMQTPIMLQQFKNKKGFQINVPYLKHDVIFPEIIQDIKDQMFLPLDGDICLKDLFSFMDLYAKTSSLAAAPNSYLQAKQKEYKLCIATYENDDEQIKNILRQIQENNWDVSNFKMFNINLNDWLISIKEFSTHGDGIVARIRANALDKSFRKLPISELKSEKR